MAAVTEFLKANGLLAGALFYMASVTAGLAILPADITFPILHAMRLVVSVVLIITFARALPLIVREPRDQGSQLIIGILFAWSAEVMISAWGLAWRISDQSWMLDSPVLGALLALKIMGGTFHVTSPRALDGRVPRRSWLLLVAGALIAALMAGIVIGARWSTFFVEVM
ncbi:hypothetical protein GCM10007301_15700 [Azorhizobium oxalatiphilum]|uniref:Transmembrane protein n=1 Tax=Azorhizobium oxalatiphilum TaxID=980631 RepID=A0A917BU36_9HYPH|nr:hypothetical protein [Azorhizobium oxalatiphilum]GGF56863.1 hypothetical protein GCM10007301_15700 [Azorhizobium oxalatiphilum]